MAPPPRRRLPPAERRALIEEVAGQLFGEEGYAATRLDDVAAAAGVTKPMLYRHFDSKKALYLALLARHRADLPGFLEPPAVPEGPLEARLPRILDAWFAYVAEHPYSWKMLFRDTTGDEEIGAFRRDVQSSAREVLAGMVRDSFGVPEEEVEPLAEVIRTGMAGLALWWLDNPEVPRSVLVQVLMRVIGGLAGAGQPTGAGSVAPASRSAPAATS